VIKLCHRPHGGDGDEVGDEDVGNTGAEVSPPAACLHLVLCVSGSKSHYPGKARMAVTPPHGGPSGVPSVFHMCDTV